MDFLLPDNYDELCLRATYCYLVGGMHEGFAVHALGCQDFGRYYSGPNSTCVQPEEAA